MAGKKSNLFSRNQLREIDEFAKNNGYLDATEYLLEAHNNYKKTVNTSKPFIRDANWLSLAKAKVIHKSKLGTILNYDSLNWLHNPWKKNKVDLIMTSPPFALLSKKSYGNELASEYCEWFRPFAGTVLEENANEWFDFAGMKSSPFMMYAVDVKQDKIPAITHVDGTCRIQTFN